MKHISEKEKRANDIISAFENLQNIEPSIYFKQNLLKKIEESENIRKDFSYSNFFKIAVVASILLINILTIYYSFEKKKSAEETKQNILILKEFYGAGYR